MNLVLLLIACVHSAGLLLILLALHKAPYGYEDGEGFHEEAGQPVPAPSRIP
jgi:hypothetical protein